MNTGLCQRGHNLAENPYISPVDGKRRCNTCRQARDATRHPLPQVSFADRFWAKVDKNGPNGCWIWQGAVCKKGYGRVRRGNTWLQATEVAWELTVGEAPSELWRLHRCDNPPCVNPAHLFLGTALDNWLDMVSKGRACFQ